MVIRLFIRITCYGYEGDTFMLSTILECTMSLYASKVSLVRLSRLFIEVVRMVLDI